MVGTISPSVGNLSVGGLWEVVFRQPFDRPPHVECVGTLCVLAGSWASSCLLSLVFLRLIIVGVGLFACFSFDDASSNNRRCPHEAHVWC